MLSRATTTSRRRDDALLVVVLALLFLVAVSSSVVAGVIGEAGVSNVVVVGPVMNMSIAFDFIGGWRLTMVCLVESRRLLLCRRFSSVFFAQRLKRFASSSRRGRNAVSNLRMHDSHFVR